jgi:hypothetical protein
LTFPWLKSEHTTSPSSSVIVKVNVYRMKINSKTSALGMGIEVKKEVCVVGASLGPDCKQQ